MRSLLLLLPLLFAFACKKSSPSDACANAMCTLEFRTLQVCFTDSANRPQLVDSVQIQYANGTVLTNQQATGYPGPACYPVESDNWVEGHRNTRETLRLRAFISGKMVVDTPYVISADCCHISKISGPDTLVVH